MPLEEFLKLWTENGTRLVEHDRQTRNGFLWILYGVYFPESTVDYGRHMALLLKIAGNTGKILGHDMHNITGETAHREVDWFLDNVAKYSDSLKEVVCVSKQGAPEKPKKGECRESHGVTQRMIAEMAIALGMMMTLFPLVQSLNDRHV